MEKPRKNRTQPLPLGRTGHGAPPCRWSPGSPGPQCSCCKSSPCWRSGRLWCPEGLNGWWCPGILQRKKHTLKHWSKAHGFKNQKHALLVKRAGSFQDFLRVCESVCNTQSLSLTVFTIRVSSDTTAIKSRQRREFWLVSQSESLVFTLALARIFPLLCGLVKKKKKPHCDQHYHGCCVISQKQSGVSQIPWDLCVCAPWGNIWGLILIHFMIFNNSGLVQASPMNLGRMSNANLCSFLNNKLY